MLVHMVANTVGSAFVGRADELDALRTAFRRSGNEGPVTVLLGGEAGVGKTRLTTEFTQRAEARVLVGGCLELGVDGLPYAPFTEMLRDLIRELGVAAVTELAPAGTDELARLLPELGNPAPAGEHARARLFEQMLMLFERLAEQRRLVLLIEDAHWAERSTDDLILFLARNFAGPILLIVTYRTDELHRRHPLRPLLAQLDRSDNVSRVELPRLTRAEVALQAAMLVGTDLEPARLTDVYDRSAGNPLFVEVLVSCDGEDGCDLLASLHDLLFSSVARLPDRTQQVLRTVAASPGRIGHRLLAAVTGLDDATLTDALRPAVAGNVLVIGGNGYEFRHALLRETVQADALPGERGPLHTRFATAIEADPGLVPPDRVAAELAHHWYAAGDRTWALISAWQAAGHAAGRLAYAEQLRMLERVLDLWDEVDDARRRIDADRTTVLEHAVRSASLSGEYERTVALATLALQRIDTADAPERAVLLLDLRGRALHNLGRVTGIDDHRKAVAILPVDPPTASRAWALSSLAQSLHLEDNLGEAARYAHEALSVARAAGTETAEAHALITSACAVTMTSGPPDVEARLAHLTQAYEVVERVGDTELILRALINESDMFQGVGRFVDAVAAARFGVRRATELGVARAKGTFMAINLAEPLISLGRWTEAQEVLQHALELIPPSMNRASLLQLQGGIAVGRGDLETARAAVSSVLAIQGTAFFRAQNQLPAARLRVDLAVAEGDPGAGLEIALAGLRQPGAQRSARYSWPLVVAGARAAGELVRRFTRTRDETDRTCGADGFARLGEIAGALDTITTVDHAHVATWQAEALAGAEPTTATLAAWDGAARAWMELHEPYAEAQAMVRAVETALAIGDRPAATLRARRAVEQAETVGARRLLHDIEELVGNARLSVGEQRSAEPTPALGLTPRERDVLARVAAGRTNRQIADELFISAKTASVHVSNILGKLDVGTRGEAAATAHRLHLFD